MRYTFLVLGTAIFLLSLGTISKTQTIEEKIREKKALLHQTILKEKSILEELQDIAEQIEKISTQIIKIQEKIKTIGKEIENINIQLNKLQTRKIRLQENISKEMEILLTISRTSWINFIFKPQDINELLRNEDYLYTLIVNETYKLKQIKKTEKNLKNLKEELNKKLKELNEIKEKYRKKKKELILLEQEKKTLLPQILSKKRLYKEILNILETAKKEMEKLALEISETKKKLEEEKYRNREVDQNKTKLKKVVLRPLFEVKGFLYPPVEGQVLRFFGLDRDLFTGKITFSPGIFIGAPPGSPVVAPFSARVIKIRWIKGQGQVAVLDHGYNFISIIGGLGTTKVFPGEEVRTGEVLGTVGASPYGPNGVYYELRYGQKPQNPLEWLNLKKLKILR